MAELGLQAYRFSVSWPRVLPDSETTVNPAGLGFYDRLVDALLARGIAPVATLYDWDLPQQLQDAGGWTSRQTCTRLADLAYAVADRLGDRVGTWITLNEPWCAAYLGYYNGVHAPGRRDPAAAFSAVHHLLLGHGQAVQALRATLPRTAQVGIALNLIPMRPASEAPADLDATRSADGRANRIFLDPLRYGRYPEDVLAETASITVWSFVADGDLRTICAPIDLLGVNYYQPHVVRAATAAESTMPGAERAASVPLGGPTTGMGWGIDPSGLAELLLRLHQDWPEMPIMVTENGAAFPDEVVDGHVHDEQRIAYLRRHVDALGAAIAAGVAVRGYFVWSLMDNFEWAWGYQARFGIVYVDYATQQRTIKDCGYWYRDMIAAQRA